MASIRFRLTGHGIEQVGRLVGDDFAVVVNGVEYKCSRVEACFFSKRVCRMVMCDRTTDQISLNLRNNGAFGDVMSLMRGHSVRITPENVWFLEECARELENEELLGTALAFALEGDEIGWENVVRRIRTKKQCNLNYKEEVIFIARNFFDVNLSFVEELDVSELEEVLQSPSLKLKSEDQLFEMISSLIDKNGVQYSILLRNIQFQLLETDALERFLDYVFPDYIDSVLWRNIRQFICTCSENNTEKKAVRSTYQEYTSDLGPFCGIFAALREKVSGNPHTQGAIQITASDDSCPCYVVVDYGRSGYWCSMNEENSYIQFDFKSNRICVNEYSLKSDGVEVDGLGEWHLISWVIEVSDDAVNWEIIDTRHTDDLNGNLIVKTYKCQKPSQRFCRYVRLRQTGKNSGGADCLLLSEIEFFGKFQEA